MTANVQIKTGKRVVNHWIMVDHFIKEQRLHDDDTMQEVICIDEDGNILQGYISIKDGNVRCSNDTEFMDNVSAYITVRALSNSFKPVPSITGPEATE